MIPYIDIHTHQFSSSAVEIKNCFPQEINFSRFTEPNKFFSVGLHPWYVDEAYEKSLLELELAVKDNCVLAIGEAGLDKACDISFDLQKNAFVRQIKLSEEYQKPLIIHCVKAYNELQQIKKEFQPNSTWIIHGFRGKIELAQQLLAQGFYLSFGYALEHMQEVVEAIPMERVFLETDDKNLNIEEIYALFSRMKLIDLDLFKQKIYENFTRVFDQ